MKFEEEFPNLVLKEQDTYRVKDLIHTRWTMEELLKDIQKFCIEKQRVKEVLHLQERMLYHQEYSSSAAQSLSTELYENKLKELGL